MSDNTTQAPLSPAQRQQLLDLYPVLTSLSEERLDALLQSAAVVAVPAGAQLFAEHQPCMGFPLLLDGSIKVVKLSNIGRELMLYRVTPGRSCIISSSCLLGKSDYNARGLAETALLLVILPIPEFSRLLLEYASFRDFVFHLFAERISDLMQLVDEVAFARLDRRLAKRLLVSDETVLNITHQQLADDLGSVREIVSRLLKGFAAQGLVSLAREQVRITDRTGLQSLAAM